MAKNDELDGIERDIILKEMQIRPMPITVHLGDTSAGTMFPIGVGADKVKVSDEGVLLVSSAAKGLRPLVGRPIRVQFYYNHLGLFFISILGESAFGYSIEVPPRLYKVQREKKEKEDYSFTASISYKAKGKEDISLSAFPHSAYNLLVKPSWQSIEPSLQSAAQVYYERYVFNLPIRPHDDISYLISICRYVSQQVTPPAVEGTIKPFDIIYIDETKIVLGCIEQDALLQLDADYSLKLHFVLGQSALLKRMISIQMTITDMYTSGDRRVKCLVGSYSAIKQEDARFLHEKFCGTKFTKTQGQY